MTNRYVSVFSGAGGLDHGLAQAGYKPGTVSDESRSACDTLRAALPAACVLPGDVHDLLNSGAFATAAAGGAALVAGQPPLVGKVEGEAPVDPDGDTPQLLYRFMDVTAQVKPTAFIMAAMPFLNSSRWGAVLGRLRRRARELGYDTYTPVIDAAEYGVPQHRYRLFLIGMPKGCKPAAAAVPRGGKLSSGAAIRAIPPGTRDIPCPSGVRLAERPVVRNSPYSGQLLAGPGRMLDLRRVSPLLSASLGGNKTPVIDVTQLESDAVPRIEGYHDYLWRLDGQPDRYGEDITRYMRRLSLRECAALQGFPPDYPLRGSAVAQFKIVGAAVPPALGRAVGRAVAEGLR